MNRLAVLAANVAATVVLTAVPAWAQFNLNGGNNTRGVHFVDPDNITASASSEQDSLRKRLSLFHRTGRISTRVTQTAII